MESCSNHYMKLCDSITQVCNALQCIHNQHIVHGNIQPSSLLIQSDHTVLLTNFSMKHIYQENDPLVAQIEEGNAAYVAPEQVVGMITPASDIYAVGVLLYRLLTGHLPYDGESAGEIALKHANEAIPPLRQFRPDLSEAVELVIRVALAKSPEARFPSAEALAKALLAAIVADSPPIVSVRAQRRIRGAFEKTNYLYVEPCSINDCDIAGIIWIDWHSQFLFDITTVFRSYSRSSISCKYSGKCCRDEARNEGGGKPCPYSYFK